MYEIYVPGKCRLRDSSLVQALSISACHADDPSLGLIERVYTIFCPCPSSSIVQYAVQEGTTSSLQNFTAGTFAAVAATVLTQPTDVIRTHMQLGHSANARLGVLAIMKAIVNLNGPKALLAGAAPRVSVYLRNESSLSSFKK